MSVENWPTLDHLSDIPEDVKRWSSGLADRVEQGVDSVAKRLRGKLSDQSWLPEVLRPDNDRSFVEIHRVQHAPYYERLYEWCMAHQAWSAAAAAFVLTGAVMVVGRKVLYSTKKRKARRAGNGARKEIIVIAGSPHEALTKSIALDLERRGFIVYITVSTVSEERIVKNENREDILPLMLDVTTPLSKDQKVHPSLEQIHSLITKAQSPMAGIPPHLCHLSGLVLIPSTAYPTGPVGTIAASRWADTVNTRILSPILTTQLLLPLLTINNNPSSIVLLSPSIQTSLSGPFAGPEVTSAAALSGFLKSLRRELKLPRSVSPVDVVELKLGNINLGQRSRSSGAQTGGELLAWDPQQRDTYGEAYLHSVDNRPGRSSSGAVSGSNARDLHFAVFDALAPCQKNMFGLCSSKPESVYVGRGARTYAFIGRTFPSSVVGWMLGLRTGSN